LIEEITDMIHSEIHEIVDQIVAENNNAIEENYKIRSMFKEMFKAADTSPVYQLKKHYPSIFEKVMAKEMNECNILFKNNIEKGIAQGLYRKEIPVETFVKFYYNLLFSIKEQTISEKEGQELELQILEYHTRAIATPAGIAELEKQLLNIEKK
jgi:hypothetical protein